VSDLKPDHQRRDLYKLNLPVTSRKIGPVPIETEIKDTKDHARLLSSGPGG
jgi:hypothetical protein